ncbi:MAG: TIGR04551 family protein [Myxococcales bacterium]
MRRPTAIAALCLLFPLAALAQTEKKPPQRKPPAQKQQANPPPGESTDAKTGQSSGAAAGDTAQAPSSRSSAQAEKPSAQQIDPEEFRRQVMEEVRRELQKAKEDMEKQTAWIEQDSAARVQDSEAVEQLRQRVNLFQPHGYFRLRGEFMYNMDLGRGNDPAGFPLFVRPFIGTGDNHSLSMANMRFRFEPTFEISEDLAIYTQLDMLDNVLLGSDPKLDPFLDPFTPLGDVSTTRLSSVVNVKRVWGRVNTQLGEILFGRMGYHWGLGILHNDGNCLDCDFGDTYDRVAFQPREIKGHNVSLMFDVLAKGAFTTGEFGELGRSVDADTLDDGYRLAIAITRLDTPETIKRKLDAGEWVLNYGVLGDYRTQAWDTVTTLPNGGDLQTIAGIGSARAGVVRRGAKFYQPDAFLSLKKRKWRLDMEFASSIGSVASRASREPGPASDPNLTRDISFTAFGGALQTDLAFLPADALLLGLDFGFATGDKGAFGFGARPWRGGSGNIQPTPPGLPPYRVAGRGDIDGNHIDVSNGGAHDHANNFVFNRAFNVDMILYRNIITAITSSWYLKPSLRYRPTGRKSAGGDDTGFELMFSVMYASAFYSENTPGLHKSLGLEMDLGITYDTSDRFHTGIAYGLLLPFSGLEALPVPGTLTREIGIAHAIRAIMAIPF